MSDQRTLPAHAQVTQVQKAFGFKLRQLTITAEGGITAQFSVGTVDDSGAFKPIVDKSYVLTSEQASPVLAAPVKGELHEQLIASLVAELSKRADWIA